MKNINVKLFCCYLGLISICTIFYSMNISGVSQDANSYISSDVNTTDKRIKIDFEDEIIHSISYTEKKINLDDLENEILKLCGEKICDLGFIYYDLNSGDSIKINEDKQFSAASTVKIPLVMMLYDDFFYGYSNPSDETFYTASDYEEGCGVLLGSNSLYEPISLSTLGKYSIMYSDNIATNMIFRYISGNFRRTYLDNITGVESDYSNMISPNSMLKILLKLYENKEENPYYDILIDQMKNTIFNDRISSLIPSEIVAHKIGDYDNYINDVGIVYDNNPYIIIFYTEGFEYSEIGEISKLVYDFRKER